MSRCPSFVAIFALLFSLSLLSSTTAVPCGGAGYDLSSLTLVDYASVSGGYTYYLHLCGNVTYPGCQGLESRYGGSMLCQVPLNANAGSTNYSLAKWVPDNTGVTWEPLNNGLGVQMQLADGQGCGGDSNGARVATLNFICDTSVAVGTLTFTNLTEVSVCNYVATIRTPAACKPSASNSACGYGTLDLSSITGSDLSYKDTANNYTYYYRPCGVVTSPQCANNPYGLVAGTAMVCQASGLNNEMSVYTYDLSWWNPTLAQWRYAGGIQTYILDIQDGVTCGGYGSRTVQIRFECQANATTPSLYAVQETTTCFYVLYIKTSLACGGPPPITTPNGCGGAYDLAPVSLNDMIYTAPNGFIYAFNPCGVVSYQQCQSNPNTNRSMFCQAESANPTAHNIATWDPTKVSYQPTLNGLQMYIADGDTCGSATAYRSLTVNFQCNRGTPANSPQLIAVTEPQQCQYVATVNTSTVCRTGPPTLCGTNGYDFSLYGNSPDYSWVSKDLSYTYYFRPCGATIAPTCANSTSTAGSMMCQSVNGQLGGWDIAVYDSNLVSWAKLTNGWQMYVQDGTSCGTYDRALTVNFICQQGVAYMANLTETSTCNYVAIIMTPQACAPVQFQQGASTGVAATTTGLTVPAYEAPAGCGGPYNLNALASQDLVYMADPNYNWYLRPCGSVSNANCSNAAASSQYGVMLCQASKQNNGGSTAASAYSTYATQYTPIRGGLLMTLVDGAYCGVIAAPRTTNVRFICNQNATTAYIYNLTESPTCTYNVWVYTSLVCPAPAATCTGAGWDLSRLNSGADLQLTNISASNYYWYFSPCSTVSSAVCQSYESTAASMFCQVDPNSNSTYEIATYIPQDLTWNALPGGNGVQWVIQDGTTCGGNGFERTLTVNFVCANSGNYQGAVLQSVQEVTICNYVATVSLLGDCNQWKSGGGSSSSSSLSGGAIAGIVIGSIVGALIILGVLVVLCCGAGAGMASRKQKTTDDDGPRSSGKFNTMEASHTNDVEMETSNVHTNDGGEGEVA